MYNSANDLMALVKEKNVKISDIVLENECKISEKSRDEVLEKTRGILQIMIDSSNSALENEIISVSGLSGGDAKKLETYRKKGKSISGNIINSAMAKALSCSEVNASMGRIVAAPTAGSCGIVPAAIITGAEILDVDDSTRTDIMVRALLTASGIGQIAAKNATLSGAEGGCQAECGVAAAMAAAALVEMFGGTPEMSFNAAAISIMNVLGLICDPVAGLVEIPCGKRNTSGVVNAMTCADIALAGVDSVIPFDEVIATMYKVGKQLPVALRETSMGGLATTPTALKLAEQLSKKQ